VLRYVLVRLRRIYVSLGFAAVFETIIGLSLGASRHGLQRGERYRAMGACRNFLLFELSPNHVRGCSRIDVFGFCVLINLISGLRRTNANSPSFNATSISRTVPPVSMDHLTPARASSRPTFPLRCRLASKRDRVSIQED
jgi:hypothetical protein